MENKIWFVSDTHFGHIKDFLWSPRGFNSIEEHDEALVKNWNETVKENDIVVHLGDICLNNNDKGITYINRLNGEIIWIRGNHDTDNRINFVLKNCKNVRTLNDNSYVELLKYHKLFFYCSHYPTYTGNVDDKYFSQHVINLHGHTHSVMSWFDPTNPFMYNVGVDAHLLKPVLLTNIIETIRANWASLSQQ